MAGTQAAWKAERKFKTFMAIIVAAVILGVLAGAIAAGRLRVHVPW